MKRKTLWALLGFLVVTLVVVNHEALTASEFFVSGGGRIGPSRLLIGGELKSYLAGISVILVVAIGGVLSFLVKKDRA